MSEIIGNNVLDLTLENGYFVLFVFSLCLYLAPTDETKQINSAKQKIRATKNQ